MDLEKLCPGCFDDRSGQNPCPSCGYETETAEASLYLECGGTGLKNGSAAFETYHYD
jgi:hypothetical protein